jgi:hypothetical protein
VRDFPDVRQAPGADDRPVPRFRLSHRHDATECPAAFAAWRGFQSPLRHRATVGTCVLGGHEIWWDVEADGPGSALTLLPPFVAERTTAMEVREITVP